MRDSKRNFVICKVTPVYRLVFFAYKIIYQNINTVKNITVCKYFPRVLKSWKKKQKIDKAVRRHVWRGTSGLGCIEEVNMKSK